MSKKKAKDIDEENRLFMESRVFFTGDYYKAPELRIDEYLSEKKDEIFNKIKEHDRLLLISPTGSGKSHLIIDNTDELLKTYDRIIFVVPLLSLQSQIDDEWETDLAVNHKIATVSSDMCQVSKKITCTYRSFHKITSFLDNQTLIIFDEFHTFFNDNLAVFDSDYIFRDIRSLEQALISDANILALTATPQVFISRTMGFRSLVVSFNSTPYKRNVTVSYMTMVMSRIYAVILTKKRLLNKENSQDKKIVVYYKNIDVLNFLFSAIYKKKYDSLNLKDNPVITSEKLRDNESGFNEFIEDVFEKDNIIFTTNAITTGISILNKDVHSVLVFNVTDYNEIIQLTSRFRNSKDLTIDVYLDNMPKSKDGISKKIVFNDKDLKDIENHYENILEKKESDFNTSVLQTIRKKQLNLLKSNYYHINNFKLKDEINKFPGYSCSAIKGKKVGVNNTYDETRKDFFKRTITAETKKERHLLVFDLNLINDGIGEFLRLMSTYKSKNDDYNLAIEAFAEPKFLKASKIYFNINKILNYADNNLLISNWQFLKTTNCNDFLMGILSNYYLNTFILKSESPTSDHKPFLLKNFTLFDVLFRRAVIIPKFKQKDLSKRYSNYKFLNDISINVDFKQKDFTNIIKGMFVIEKRVKVDGDNFYKFKEPSFTNANPSIGANKGKFTIDHHRFIVSKENNETVLYVYELAKNGNYELIKEKSKVLVPKKDIIKMVARKYP